MKKFQFRLQRVMDAKESEERQKQRELGQALEVLHAEELKLKMLYEEQELTIQQQRELTSGSATAADLMLHNRWLRRIAKNIRVQSEVIERQKQEVEFRRRKLIEVSRERKVLEKLRERRYEEYRLEEARSLQNLLDDIGSRQWSENQKSENGSPE